MKKEIRIPPAGESVSEVTVGRILKPSGSFVEESEEILELETEKVNQVIYAPASGELTWEVEEGQSVQIDDLVGYIETEVKELKKPKEKPQIEKAHKEEVKEEVKKEEKEHAPVRVEGKRESRVKMSRIRKVIASRLVESLHNSAMLTTFNDVDMTRVMDLRSEHKESFLQKTGVKLGMTSFFVQAVIAALKEFPLLNSYIDGDEIVTREYYNIGVAVSTERGLVVPVVRDADKLSFTEIERLIVTYAQKARNSSLKIEDLEGGGFTISNGGVFGSLLSTPILNPPQVGILGLHRIDKRPVVIDNQITIRPIMYLALSYDHRIIDGRDAILFLVKVKEALENFTLSF